MNFHIIDEIFLDENSNIYMVVLLRLIFIPFGFTSYVLGVTSIPFCPYIIGTSVYCLKCCLYCFMGCALYKINVKKMNNKHGYENLVFAAEIIFTLLLTIFISIKAKEVFDRKLARKSIQ